MTWWPARLSTRIPIVSLALPAQPNVSELTEAPRSVHTRESAWSTQSKRRRKKKRKEKKKFATRERVTEVRVRLGKFDIETLTPDFGSLGPLADLPRVSLRSRELSLLLRLFSHFSPVGIFFSLPFFRQFLFFI